jgi:hypothetical protein
VQRIAKIEPAVVSFELRKQATMASFPDTAKKHIDDAIKKVDASIKEYPAVYGKFCHGTRAFDGRSSHVSTVFT